MRFQMGHINRGLVQHSAVVQQLVQLRPLIALGGSIALISILGMYTISRVTQTPLAMLTQDPAAVTKTMPYIGMLSIMGVLLWAASVTACFVGALVLYPAAQQRPTLHFLLAFGMLSLLLMLDDLFLLHEAFLPKILGIPEVVAYGSYLVMLVGGLLYFLREILTSGFTLLVLALSFLGLSIAIDILLPTHDLTTFVEDSLKFAGIVFWCIYFLHTVVVALREHAVTLRAT